MRIPISKNDRFRILNRDNHTCQYCGKKAPDVVLEIDHKVPVSKGGSNKHENLVTSCFDCNRGKGNSEAMEKRLVISGSCDVEVAINLILHKLDLDKIGEPMFRRLLEHTYAACSFATLGKMVDIAVNYESKELIYRKIAWELFLELEAIQCSEEE